MTLACPVCRARFRGEILCPRCGADLSPLMRLAARSWHARQEARRCLAAGATEQARHRIEIAQRLHATRAGRQLELLIAWAGREAGRGERGG